MAHLLLDSHRHHSRDGLPSWREGAPSTFDLPLDLDLQRHETRRIKEWETAGKCCFDRPAVAVETDVYLQKKLVT